MNLRGLSRVTLLGGSALVSTFFVTACDDDASGGGIKVTVPDGRADGGPVDPSSVIDAIAGLPGASIDIGLGDCGTTVTKTVEVTNSGGKNLEVALAADAPFEISPPTLVIPAGGKGTVTLSIAVPQTSSAGTPIVGKVVVTTNDPKKPTIDVPVSVTPAGATLAFEGAVQAADFGTAKLGVKDTDVTLKLKNVGNKAASFTFGAPSDPQFSVAASPAAVEPGAVIDLTASFTPDKLTPSTSSASVVPTGAICGTSVSKIDLAGQGTVGNVTGWPVAGLDFGGGLCGGPAAAPRSFTLTNVGPEDVTITAVTPGTKGYTPNVAPGAKVPKDGGTLVVTVTPPVVPSPSSIPGNFGDTLTLTTDLPNDAPHAIPLSLTATGAVLQFDTAATPNFGSFGFVPVGASLAQDLAIANIGNAAAAVTTSAGSGPFSVSEGSFSVPAGGSHPFAARFTPTTNSAVTGSLTVAASGLCQPLPSALPLAGQGVSGGIAISVTALSFQAPCGSAAAPKTFTITNPGNATLQVLLSLGDGAASHYTISPTDKILGALGSTTITVTPKPFDATPSTLAPAAYADTISITTDIPGDSPHLVSLGDTPIGAVLSFAPASLPFGDVPVNTSSTPAPLSVVNSGNPGSAATVQIVSSDPSFVVNTAPGTSSPASPYAATVSFLPGASVDPDSASLSVTTASPLCAPLPAPITATGQGTLAKVVFEPKSLPFGNVNCGSQATARTVVFTNSGNEDYTITPALLKGTHHAIAMTPPSGVVPKNNGGSVTITVTPSPIPAHVATVPDTETFSDVLRVTTTAAGDAPHDIPITEGAQGVILRPIQTNHWDFGSVNFGATRFFNQSLRNDGNVPVSVSMSPLTNPEFGFNSVSVGANSTVQIQGSFTPSASSGTWTDAGTIGVPAGTVECQPRPSFAITMSGTASDGDVVSVDGNLTFPAATCGGAAGPTRVVTITNNGNTTQSWSTFFNNGTYYSVDAPTFGTVAPFGGTATLVVRPAPVPAGVVASGPSLTDQLIVDVGSESFTLPISQLALGADLTGFAFDAIASDAASAAFYDANGYWSDTAGISFINKGNRSVSATTTIAPSAGWSVAPSPLTVQALPGDVFQRQDLRMTGTGQSFAACTTTAIATTTLTGPICQDPFNLRSAQGRTIAGQLGNTCAVVAR